MTFHISYPAELPVAERREDLMAAIAANQVTIIAGETGSGKPRRSLRCAWNWGSATTA